MPLPDNLTLTVSRDENRDLALVRLLREKRFADFKSIIIYCTRREECERVAKHLRTYFQVLSRPQILILNSNFYYYIFLIF